MNKLKALVWLIMVLVLAGVNVDAHHDSLEDLKAAFGKVKGPTARFKVADSLYRKYSESDLTIASFFANQMYLLSDSVKTDEASIKSNHAMSLTLGYLGDFTGSIAFCQRELDLGTRLKDSLVISRAYINMGDNYTELGQYNLAYYYLSKAMEISLQSSNEIDAEYATHNFGRVHKELGQYRQAIEYFNRAEELSAALNDVQSPMYTLREMGDVAMRQGKYEEALEKLKRALQLSYDLDVQVVRPDIFIDLGRLYIEMAKPDQALSYYDSARSLGRSLGNKFIQAKCLVGYGKIFRLKKNSAAATANFLQALDLATAIRAKVIQITCLDQLASLAESQGNFKDGLSYYKRYELIKDSLYNKDIPDQTLKYQMQFLKESKDREIASLNEINQLRDAELDKQQLIRNLLIVVMGVGGILLYLLYRSNSRRRQANDQLENQRKELERRSDELEELNRVKDKFFSIISHDLRSPINSLSGVLNLMEKNGVTAEELPLLTRELRLQFNHTKNLITNLLNWALLQMDRVTLKKEKLELSSLVEENIKLSKTLSNKNVELINQVESGTQFYGDQNMTNMILRNLILNAVKFTESGGRVLIGAEERGKELVVSVQDNGVGIPPDVQKLLFTKNNSYTSLGTANEKGTGLGLNLCKEFAERQGGKIWFDSQVDMGTTFYFSIPKQG
ncbi:MAG: tetratricopeptide repeat-containing sensor histidine kinase [Bacteroidetes bacterium]|nr:tetratricopeptide repeat-containing sensor histidine kinase [Bacteroidota bacterium]